MGKYSWRQCTYFRCRIRLWSIYLLAGFTKQKLENLCSRCQRRAGERLQYFFQKAGYKNVQFGIEDLTKYQSPSTYNLVVCVDVMEHILEDEQVFKNYAASLKAGGMLVISTPSDQGGSDVHGDDQQSFIEEHVRDGYNIDDIKVKLLRNGFSRVEAKYSYGTPGKISWRLSMKYPISALGYTKAFLLFFHSITCCFIQFVLC